MTIPRLTCFYSRIDWLPIVTALLMLLFVYTAVSKVINWPAFAIQMERQALPPGFSKILAWILPPLELLIAGLLGFRSTIMAGLTGSFILMSCFTIYVGLALLGLYPQVPCSCGGVLKHMGWLIHFWFNLFFLLLSFLGIILINRERRMRRT